MWQFLCGKTHETDDARIVSLKEVFDLDSSVGVIKDCLAGIVQQEKTGRMIGLLEGVRMYPYERFILRTEWNGKEWYLRYRRNVMGLFGKKKERASEEKHQEMKEYIREAGGSIVIKSILNGTSKLKWLFRQESEHGNGWVPFMNPEYF